MAGVQGGDYCGGGGEMTTPRTNTAARESVRLNDRQPLLDECARLETELARLRNAMSASSEEICQTAGKALGYPWFKDDQKNFPGADDTWGVCVGEHVSETIVEELAKAFVKLSSRLETAAADRKASDEEWQQQVLDREKQLLKYIEFVGDLIEIDHNDTDAAHWVTDPVKLTSGSTLYIGGNKP